jgi:uncharacterized repeat protein (TIGR01451 family)
MLNGIEHRHGFFAGYGRGLARIVRRLAAIAALGAGLAATAHATGTITVNSTAQRSSGTSSQCTLGAAIVSANTNTAADGCTIGGTATAPYTINIPAGTYTLSNIDNTTIQGVPFGLPVIQNTMTLQGAAAATTTIERSSANGTADFGLLIIGQNVNTITLNDLTFQNGKGTAFGGGVTLFNGNNALAVNRCVFQNNSTAADGGGIGGVNAPPITIADSAFLNNKATGRGGAATGELTITNSYFTGSQAGLGGGALFCTQGGCGIQVTDSVFGNDKTATGPGGAIWAASVNILRSVFETSSANDMNSSGAAVFSSGGSITDSFFSNNGLSGSNSSGGAVAGNNLTITGSTFLVNFAASGGAFDGSNSTLVNDTFWNNFANDGGAIHSGGGNTYNNITVVSNRFTTGGSAGISFGADTIGNSIVAGNQPADCVQPLPVTSQGHNLIGVGCGIVPASGDQMGTAQNPIDPVLGRLSANNGKKAGGQLGNVDVSTMAVLTGSPALDAGDLSSPGTGGTSCAATDERGVLRPVGSACDIGAFEAKLGGESTSYDLSVTNTPSSTNAVIGSNFTFTVVVHNSDSDTATGILLSDSIIPFKFVSLTAPTGWNCLTPAVGASGLVTCTKPSLDPDKSWTFSLVVQPSSVNLGGSATNTAGVTSNGNDTDLTNNSSTTPRINILDPPTDLSLTMTGSPNSVNVGSNVTYVLTVKNNGPANTDRVDVFDTQPANTTVVSSTISTGGSCGVNNGTLDCFIGSLANGATATVTIVLSPQAGAVPSITNSASVSAAEIDPTPGNNTASVTTTVNPAVSPDFNVSVSSPSATVAQGGKASYPVTLTPSGGFTGSVQFACTGLPAESSCSSVPSPVSVSGSSPVQATLVIQTTAPITSSLSLPAAGNWNKPGSWPAVNLAAILSLMIAFISAARFVRSRAWRIRYASLAFGLGLFLCVGCGGNAKVVDNGTPKGSYTITVTATSGQTTHKSTITVVVGP